jgi:hypothetical protein
MRVLVVGNEQAVLDHLEKLVRHLGHRVLALKFPSHPTLSESVLEVFEKAAVFGPRVAIVRSAMPGRDGRALAGEIQFASSCMRFIFLDEADCGQELENPYVPRGLPLPFEPEALERLLDDPSERPGATERRYERLLARGIPADEARELAKSLEDDGRDRQPAPTRREVQLPGDPNLLEEVNLPAALAASLAGQTVTVSVFPEEGTFDPTSEARYVPPRVFFADDNGRVWRLPRRWLPEYRSSEPPLNFTYEVTREYVREEVLFLPPMEDLQEINLPGLGGKPIEVEAHYRPGEPVRIFWPERHGGGPGWRIPHDWRRRRVLLPGYEVLVGQGVPEDVAREYAGQVVGVNYHPGSLCCLREHYRIYDPEGNRWPVRIADCAVVGLGNEMEFAV